MFIETLLDIVKDPTVSASVRMQAANEIARLTSRKTELQGQRADMENVFDGKPDARQSADVIKTSRFRPVYSALTPEQKKLHDEIKAKAAELETLFERVQPGRYHELGMNALEEAVMWTVKELTSGEKT